jgi:hypothetical protein
MVFNSKSCRQSWIIWSPTHSQTHQLNDNRATRQPPPVISKMHKPSYVANGQCFLVQAYQQLSFFFWNYWWWSVRSRVTDRAEHCLPPWLRFEKVAHPTSKANEFIWSTIWSFEGETLLAPVVCLLIHDSATCFSRWRNGLCSSDEHARSFFW